MSNRPQSAPEFVQLLRGASRRTTSDRPPQYGRTEGIDHQVGGNISVHRYTLCVVRELVGPPANNTMYSDAW
jgi:hypothetical protein